MVDTREASVSNPCLVPLLSLNAAVPALSMPLGNLASHVLHRIQVCVSLIQTAKFFPQSILLGFKEVTGKDPIMQSGYITCPEVLVEACQCLILASHTDLTIS